MQFVLPLTMAVYKDRRSRSRRRIKRLLLLGWITLFSGMRLAFPISLPEAVALALHKSPEVATSQKQLSILEQQRKQVSSGYFPSIDIATGFGNEKTSNTSTSRFGEGSVSLSRTDTRLAVNQMLFDGFGTANKVKMAQAKYKAADWTYQKIVQVTALEAVNRFVEVREQRELLDLVKNFSDVQGEFLAKVREWYEGGAGTVADVWQTESRLVLTQSSVTTTMSQMESAMDAFERMFGVSPDHLDPVPSVSAHIPASLVQALAKAERLHPSLMEDQMNMEAVAANLDASRAVFLPSVSLALEANRTRNVGGAEDSTQSTAAMVRLNYNFFRGGNDLASSREASSRVDQAQDESAKVKLSIQENIEKSWRTVQELRQRLTYLEQHVTISKQVVDAYYEQFFTDNRPLLNVLNGENELFSARSNLVKGRYALFLEEYRFLANLGVLHQVMAELSRSGSPDDKDVTQSVFVGSGGLSIAKSVGELAPLPAPVAKIVKKSAPVPAPVAETVKESVPSPTPIATADIESAPLPAPIAGANTESAPSPMHAPAEISTIQGATLTSSKQISLYRTPQMGTVPLKIVPEATPLRILGSQKGWFHVVGPGGKPMWMVGPITQDGELNQDWQSGLITLDQSPTKAAAASPVTQQKNFQCYAIQVGAFSQHKLALTRASELILKGVDAHVTESQGGRGPSYAVRIGCFQTQTEAKKSLTVYKSKGKYPGSFIVIDTGSGL